MALEPQKRKKEPNSPGKQKTKETKKEEREQEINSKYPTAIKNEESDPNQPKASTGGSSNDATKKTGKQPKPSSTGGSSTALPKKTIVKTSPMTQQTSNSKQLSPSTIGIQKLREEFMEAKQKDLLNLKDISSFLTLLDDYKKAAGKKDIKQGKLDDLRALYNKSVYKK